MLDIKQITFAEALDDPRFMDLVNAHIAEIDALGLGVQFDPEAYLAIDRAGRLVMVVGYYEGELIAYWLWDICPDAFSGGMEACELGFYVKRAYRNGGFARELFAAAEPLLRARGARKALVTTRDCVPAGRAVAQNLGFTKFAECFQKAL